MIEMVANCGGRVPEHVFVPDVLIPLTLLLADLHRRGLVHRHIKPEHVLCTREHGAVTLVDFAECVDKTQRCLNNRAGALEYMAPEVLDKPTAEEVFHRVLYNGMSEEELPQYDEKADGERAGGRRREGSRAQERQEGSTGFALPAGYMKRCSG